MVFNTKEFKTKYLKSIFTFFIFFINFQLHANPIDEEEDWGDTFIITGYIDGAYSYMERDSNFVSSTPYISNDSSTNGFAIHQLALNIASKPKEGFGFQFIPILGQDAFHLAQKGLDPDIGISNIGFTAYNAYAQYADEGFTLYAGLLEALPGFEPIDPTTNINFSRSAISSTAVPDTVTGLRGTYKFNTIWLLSVGVNDGWDALNDTSRTKTIELGLDYTPNALFWYNISAMSGGERAIVNSTTGPTGQRTVIDTWAQYKFMPKLSLIGEYNYGWQSDAQLPDGTFSQANWQGLAGYLQYDLNKNWYGVVRAEILDDRDGYLTGVEQVWKEVTLTVGYYINKDFLIRAEARHDLSNTDPFVDKESDHLANNQQLFALEAYYKF